jgi:ribonuclease P protein component
MVVVPVRTAAKAVQRHLLKRKVSEAIRRLLRTHSARDGIRVIVRVFTPELPAVRALEEELLSLLKKSDILTL